MAPTLKPVRGRNYFEAECIGGFGDRRRIASQVPYLVVSQPLPPFLPGRMTDRLKMQVTRYDFNEAFRTDEVPMGHQGPPLLTWQAFWVDSGMDPDDALARANLVWWRPEPEL